MDDERQLTWKVSKEFSSQKRSSCMPSLTTFNANNFFLRYKFTRSYPGSKSKEDLKEAAEAGLTGFLPGVSFGRYGEKQYIVWDTQRRQLAARALKEPDGVLPDILCLQE